MINGIALIIAALSTLPILTWLLFFLFFNLIFSQKKRAVNTASDVTTIFAVTASIILARQLWHQTYGALALLVILSVGLIYTLIFWRLRREFELKKILRGIWRSTFLIFMLGDFFLFIYGVIRQFVFFT